MDIGQKLYELRQNAGLSSIELAERIGISKSYIHKLEKNTSIPTITILRAWIECTRPNAGNPSQSQSQALERWLWLSLSFLFGDEMLDDDEKGVFVETPEIPSMIVANEPRQLLKSLFSKDALNGLLKKLKWKK